MGGTTNGIRFRTTQWGVVRAAGSRDVPEARDALEELCASYWYPLYAFVRRQGHRSEDARDLTQGFFARFLAGDPLVGLDPDQGRFRAYLVAAMRHFLSNEREREQALKRGGGRPLLPLELDDAERRYSVEPAARTASPEREFERAWALTLLGRVLEHLRAEQAERGREAIFERLAGFLDGSGADGDTCAAAAAELGLSGVAVRVALHRLRARFGELLREEVGRTVGRPDEVEDELRCLVEALGG